MAVILITITESPIQLISGIPQYVTLTANIPSTIFYTLDGSTPTTESLIYIDSLKLPTNKNTVILKLYATNGMDESAIIEQSYAPNIVNNRKPHSKVYGLTAQPLPNDNLKYIGYNSPNPNVRYGNIAGITVDAPNIVGIPDGYDGTATNTYADETDLSITDYSIRYSTTNSKGETGPLIGTLPAKVKAIIPEKANNSSNANSKLFNPKAPVIIMGPAEEAEDPDHPIIMREFFSLGNIEKIKDGILLSNSAWDGNDSATGSLVRTEYNAKDNTYTFYYRDRETGQWIISKENLQLSQNSGALNQIDFSSSSSNRGLRFVYPWIPFKRSAR
jgi:hypothetical protein